MRRLALPVLVSCLLASASGAILHDLCDGSANTTPPPADPGFAHLGTNGGPTVIYVGNGWILSANHVAAQNVAIGSTVYPYVPGTKVQIQNASPPHADLAVWQIDPHPNLPVLPIRSTPIGVGAEVIMIGRGKDRGAAISGGYNWAAGNSMRWGTNQVTGVNVQVSTVFGETDSFFTDFSGPPPPLGTPPCNPPPVPPPDPRCAAGEACPEAQAANGDSGGAVFVDNGGTWELAGVIHAVFSPQPGSTALYGDITYAGDLTPALYRDQIIALVRPECSDEVDNDGDTLVDLDDPGCLSLEDDHESPDCDGADTDGDGVGDVCDGCLDQVNPSQLDADGDGCGNLCDADFDQDAGVSGSDYFVLLGCWGSAPPTTGGPTADPTCEESDLDGDGGVAGSDYLLMLGDYGFPPGPSLDPYRDPIACP